MSTQGGAVGSRLARAVDDVAVRNHQIVRLTDPPPVFRAS